MSYVHANTHANRQALKRASKFEKQMVYDTNEQSILKERKKKGASILHRIYSEKRAKDQAFIIMTGMWLKPTA